MKNKKDLIYNTRVYKRKGKGACAARRPIVERALEMIPVNNYIGRHRAYYIADRTPYHILAA